MKTKTILFTILTGCFTLFFTDSFAQDSPKDEQITIDKEKADKERLNAAVDLKRNTKSEAKLAKANAKEANRIEDDASDAAQEAKQAARMEKKAQRNRDNADKQAKKAARASEKSNNN